MVKNLHHMPIVMVGTNLPNVDDVVVEEGEIPKKLALQTIVDVDDMDSYHNIVIPPSLQEIAHSTSEKAMVEFVPPTSSSMFIVKDSLLDKLLIIQSFT